MSATYLDPKNWSALSVVEQMEYSKFFNEDKHPDRKPQMYYNTERELSPLLLYEYLKSRFGNPNGFIMLLKNDSADNLIHWHYGLSTPVGIADIMGKSSGLEIVLRSKDKLVVSKEDWQTLVNNFKTEFSNEAKKMKEVHNNLEHWKLFINPLTRVNDTVQDCLDQLDRLKLSPVDRVDHNLPEKHESWKKDMNRWVNHISKAATLGTTIRMLCPVIIEAFLNLVMFLFRKDEYKNDERLYDSLLRQQVDVRVKTLHMNCTCFQKQIDDKQAAFKKFHTLMNARNDILHGNVDPRKLFVEEVFFDQRYIPLFRDDEGIMVRTMRNYCTNVEPEKAREDFQVVSDFIEMVLLAMDEASLVSFAQFMSDRMPGINDKTKRPGSLFRSDVLVEGFAVSTKEKSLSV